MIHLLPEGRWARRWLKLLGIVATALVLGACNGDGAAGSAVVASVTAPVLKVYKDPQCGCCQAWVEHMQEAGFKLNVNDTPNSAAVKQTLGIEPKLQSCHTAVTSQANYFFEGHIPAKVVRRFLADPPAGAVGLAVPGMPIGSPGMEMGSDFEPYSVLLVMDDGSTRVYEQIDRAEAQYN